MTRQRHLFVAEPPEIEVGDPAAQNTDTLVAQLVPPTLQNTVQPPLLDLATAPLDEVPVSTPGTEGDVGVQELLDFDASLIPGLPVATTLVCVADVGGEPLVFTTSRVAFTAARQRHLATFAGSELRAMLHGAEHDRVFAWTVREWVQRKTQDPGWKLDARTAVGEVAEELKPAHWPLRRVLRRLGLMLDSVTAGDDLPPSLQGEVR